MDTIKAISGECWKLFKELYNKEKTDEAWTEYIKAGTEMVERYDGIEKEFAIEMFLAFENYIERLEEQKRKDNNT